MKKSKLLSLVGITSIALAHAGWAAGHGGGGGGHDGAGFGGGGFHGGGFRGGNGHFNSMRGGQFTRGGAGAAIGVVTITDSLMMSSSATSAFRDGGAGAIRTDIMVTTIIPTVTTTTHTVTLDTDGTDTTVAPVTDAIITAEITRAVVHRIRVACTTNMHHIING